jgi:hypothetical protein
MVADPVAECSGTGASSLNEGCGKSWCTIGVLCVDEESDWIGALSLNDG